MFAFLCVETSFISPQVFQGTISQDLRTRNCERMIATSEASRPTAGRLLTPRQRQTTSMKLLPPGPMLLMMLFLMLIPKAVAEPSPGYCQLAMQYTRHLVVTNRSRPAVVVLPGGTDGCQYHTSDLKPLITSAAKITLLRPSACLADPKMCRRGLYNIFVMVIHYHGGSTMDRVCKMLFIGAAREAQQLRVVFAVSEIHLGRFKRLAAQMDVNLATDVYVAVIGTSEILVKELYRKCSRCPVTYHNMSRWENGVETLLDRRNRVHRRSDLGGITLNAVGVKVFPIYTEVQNINGTDEPVGGVFYQVAASLAKQLNFRLNITLLDGYAYGKYLGNGTYGGMVGALQTGTADLTISEVSITTDRQQVIDFSTILSVISRCVYLRVDSEFDSWVSRYSRGISVPMALLLLLATLATGLALRCCEAFSPAYERPASLAGGDLRTFYDAVWIVVGQMFQQGAPVTPSALSSRVAFLSGLVLGLLIYTAYSATLVSFLAAADEPRPAFADLTGLLKLPHWRAGWKDGDLLENFLDWCRLFESTLQDCATLQQVYERHVLPDRENNLVDSYEEGFRKVAEGEYAFLASHEAADYYLSKIDPMIACKVFKLDVSYSPGGIALGLQKHSPYRELFNHGLQMLGEGGVLEKLYRNVLESSLVCTTDTTVQASLLHTVGAFAVLILGVVASLLILTVEWTAVRCAATTRFRRASPAATDQLRAFSRQLSNNATPNE